MRIAEIAEKYGMHTMPDGEIADEVVAWLPLDPPDGDHEHLDRVGIFLVEEGRPEVSIMKFSTSIPVFDEDGVNGEEASLPMSPEEAGDALIQWLANRTKNDV